ncbi:DMT family transporter [Janibacter sp. Y6]|uniref:DMT family transporter n=1 Tax=Janibacter sp. Y6 TaxID=2913552 RepID=UPI0034A19A33
MPTEEGGRQHALALVLACLGGLLTTLQARMNGEISATIGAPVQAALWSFGSGLALLLLLALLPAVRAGIGRIAAALRAGRLRWWQCIGGTLGAVFVAVQTYAVPLVGVAIFTVATVAGQTSNALAVDRLGVGPGGRRPVQPVRVLAALLAVVGVAVTVSGSFGDGGISVLAVVLALLAGGGVAFQQGVNARVNLESRHVLATTGQNFVAGTTLLVLLALVQYSRGSYRPTSFEGVPWWAWFGGLAGIAFIAIAAWAVAHVGVLLFGLALLTGQLGSAVLIDVVWPSAGHEVSAVMILGVLITFGAAALAGWAARPRRRTRVVAAR